MRIRHRNRVALNVWRDKRRPPAVASVIVNADHKLSEKPKSHLAATAVGCDGPRGVDSVCSLFNGAMNRGDGLLGPASRQNIELFH